MSSNQSYYVPAQSKWPIVATIGLFFTMFGLGSIMVDQSAGEDTTTAWILFYVGAAITVFMLFGWFGNVVKESRQGLYSSQMDRSFRWGMSWFIFSEIMFFGAFFGALFYARVFVLPWLSGEGDRGSSAMLWEGFEAAWPLMHNPDPEKYPSPSGTISPWGLPLLNTILLVASSITLTIGHKALKNDNRRPAIIWTAATVLLGAIFMFFQIEEYMHAYQDLNLTLQSGIYGSTFFILTGFHGAHVTIGAIILLVMTIRLMKGHFSGDDHFGYEAAAWYWHFVDVVWLGLFVFVYIL